MRTMSQSALDASCHRALLRTPETALTIQRKQPWWRYCAIAGAAVCSTAVSLPCRKPYVAILGRTWVMARRTPRLAVMANHSACELTGLHSSSFPPPPSASSLSCGRRQPLAHTARSNAYVTVQGRTD